MREPPRALAALGLALLSLLALAGCGELLDDDGPTLLAPADPAAHVGGDDYDMDHPVLAFGDEADVPLRYATVHVLAGADGTVIRMCDVPESTTRVALHKWDDASVWNGRMYSLLFQVPQLPAPDAGCVAFTAPFETYIWTPADPFPRRVLFETFPEGHYLIDLRGDRGQTVDVGTFYLGGVAVSPEAMVRGLVDDAEALGSAGDLAPGAVGALTAKLDAALAALDRGRDNAAVNQLGAFIHQVQALVRSGRLDADTGAALVAAARGAIEAIGG